MSFRRLISDELERLQPQHPRGLTVVITGHGKGKTTAALGMALRALGHGLKVCIVQFMKGDMHAGEWDAVAKLDDSVELVATGRGFLGLQGNTSSRQQHRDNAQQALNLVRDRMARGDCDLLVLDEINNAVHLKLVDLEQVLDLIRNRPAAMHLVLTGRDARPEVIEAADTVSEVREIKHAYRKGIEPQPGIDY
jgi:cob(I)alamin adenosyltransferase